MQLNQKMYQSQIMSPSQPSFPLVGNQISYATDSSRPLQQVQPASQTQSTYYFNKHKSTKQSKVQLSTLISADQNFREIGAFDHENHSATSSLHQGKNSRINALQQPILQQNKSSFKKRHVSQIQDRIHANNLKNMQMIQKQIAANTNITKNRLANRQNFEVNRSAGYQQDYSQRSHTVATSTRKKVVGDKTYFRMGALRDEKNSSQFNLGDSTLTADNRKIQRESSSIEKLQNQTFTSSFEPIILNQTGGPFNFKNGTIKQDQMQTSTNFSHAASKFADRRRKQQFSNTQSTMTDSMRAIDQQSQIKEAEDRSLSKEVLSLKAVSQERNSHLQYDLPAQKRLLDKTVDNGFLNHLRLSQADSTANESSTFKIQNEQDSFLDAALSTHDVGKGSQTISPINNTKNTTNKSSLFARTELDGKRIVNNISEIQQSRFTDDSRSQFMINQLSSTHLNDVSVIMSQTSQLQSRRLGECQNCKTWKRINQECRNFSKNVDCGDLDGVVRTISKMADIESVRKMTPELSRALTHLKDGLKTHWETERSDTSKELFKLKNKLNDTQDLAERYRKELESVTQKYREIYDYIHDARDTTILQAGSHQQFVNQLMIKTSEIDDVRAQQSKLQYSALESQLHDFGEEVTTQQNFATNTLSFMQSKVMQNKANSQFHHGLDEIFMREESLQHAAAREFMHDHFRYGLDPPVQTFEKGTITAQNMISAKYGHMSKAEKFQKEMEARQKETMTQVKIENSLLCKQNIELDQEVKDSHELMDKLELEVAFFKDLDIDDIKKSQQNHSKLTRDYEKLKKTYTALEEQKSKLIAENKLAKVSLELYEAEIQDSMDHNSATMNKLKDLRQQLTHQDLKLDNITLDQQVGNLQSKTVEPRVIPPGPGRPKAQNIFKRHMLDQKSTVTDSMNLLQRVIQTCSKTNTPLLATSQNFDAVFEKYRLEAEAQEKAKYEAKLAYVEDLNMQRMILSEEQHQKDLKSAKDASAPLQKLGSVQGDTIKKLKEKKQKPTKSIDSSIPTEPSQENEKKGVQKTKTLRPSTELKSNLGNTQQKSKLKSKSPPRKLMSQMTQKTGSSLGLGNLANKAKKNSSMNIPAASGQNKPTTPTSVSKQSEVEREPPVENEQKSLLEVIKQDSENSSLQTENLSENSHRPPVQQILEEPSDYKDDSSQDLSRRQGPPQEITDPNLNILVEKLDTEISVSQQNSRTNADEISKSARDITTPLDPVQNELKPEMVANEGVQSQKSIEIVGQIGKTKFGRVLEESGSSMRDKQSSISIQNSVESIGRLNVANRTHDSRKQSLFDKKLSTPDSGRLNRVTKVNAEVSVSGHAIDKDIYEHRQQLKSPRVSDERMTKLEEMMANFQAKPEDEQVKTEYFAMLKEAFGEDEDANAVTNPFVSQRRPAFEHHVHRHHSQSPNNLYPGDRISPSRGRIDPKYRVPTPPSIYPMSRKPKDYNEHFEAITASEKVGLEVELISRIGTETAMKRKEHHLKENTKGNQCELLQPKDAKKMAILVDKNIQTGIKVTTFAPSPFVRRQDSGGDYSQGIMNQTTLLAKDYDQVQESSDISNRDKISILAPALHASIGFSVKSNQSPTGGAPQGMTPSVTSQIAMKQTNAFVPDQKLEVVWKKSPYRSSPMKEPTKHSPLKLNGRRNSPTYMQYLEQQDQQMQVISTAEGKFYDISPSRQQQVPAHKLETQTEAVDEDMPQSESIMLEIKSVNFQRK